MLRSILSLLVILAFAGVCRAEQAGDLDWNTWRHMPAFGEDRVLPVDTFARETVEAICGRVDPTLVLGDAARAPIHRRGIAPELAGRAGEVGKCSLPGGGRRSVAPRRAGAAAAG